MSNPLYRTARWKAKRAHQLRHEPMCRLCAALGRISQATVADHVKPHRGDVALFWDGELQSLCKPCHDSVKQSQERTGQLRGCDANGNPLDFNHHWHTHDAIEPNPKG